MTVIKQQHVSRMIGDAIVLDLGDIGRQAARMRDAAEAKAQRIEAEAKRRADELIAGAAAQGMEQGLAEGRKLGHEEGLKIGRDEAFAQTKAELEHVQAAWREAADRFEQARDALQREAQQAVLELSLHLSEKIVHRAIDVDPTVVIDQVSEALAHVLGAYDVTVRISPEDRPVMQEAVPDLLAEFAHLGHITLVDDPAVRRGGCLVGYGQGQIDATLDTQLRRVVELLLPEPQAGVPSAITMSPDAQENEPST